MSRRLLTSLLLVGAATRAWGSSPEDPDSCLRPDGDACGPADHSLLQVSPALLTKDLERAIKKIGRIPGRGLGVFSKPPQDDALAGFLADREKARGRTRESQGAPLGVSDGHHNRTVANITKSAENGMSDVEVYADLMVLGRHKLCAAEGKNAGRITTLMHVLRLQSLLQVGAAELPEVPKWEPMPEEQEGLQAVEQKDKAEDVSQSAEGASQSAGQVAEAEGASQSAGWTDTSDKTRVATPMFARNKLYEDVVNNRTLTNITDDVRVKIANVIKTMQDITDEGNRLEAVGAEVSSRVQILVNLLKLEMPNCAKSGDLPNDKALLQVGAKSGGPRPAEQSVLQGSMAGRSTARLSSEDIEKLMQAPNSAHENMTYWNLTIMIKEGVTSVEQDIEALIGEKNKLSVADGEGAKKLDNLADTLDGEFEKENQGLRTSLLEIGQTIASRTAPGLDKLSDGVTLGNTSALQTNTSAKKDTKTAEEAVVELEEKLKAEEAKAAEAKSAADAAELQRASAEEKLREEVNRKEGVHTPGDSPPTAPALLDMGDVPLANLTLGVEKQVAGLEADTEILSEEKHMVCAASQEAMDRLQAVVHTLATIEC